MMPERVDHGRRWRDDDGDNADKNDFPAPLTRDQARALRERLSSVSPWQVVAAQAVAGLVVAGLGFSVSGRAEVAWSALYGAASIVIPSAVLARGVARLSGAGVAVSAVGVLIWEGVKVLLTVAMLAAAVRVVPGLSWPALLVALTVCLSMVWLSLLWRGRPKNIE
jgi:ATP synthase protein I